MIIFNYIVEHIISDEYRWIKSFFMFGDVWFIDNNNNNNDRLTAFDPGQPG